MAWNSLKAAVAAVIKTNGNQEITGVLLQSTLNSIIDQVGANSTFKGVATPSTNPGPTDSPVFYLASEKGTYSNFAGYVHNGNKLVILTNKTGSWAATELDVLTMGYLTEVISNIQEGLNSKFDTSKIYNGLDKTEAGFALDARQGKVLNAAKVDKVAGKSLILDTEITRLTSVTNQTLSGLGGEAVSNKTQTLTDSETDYPSGKAVKTAVDLKFDKDNLESVRSQSTSKVPSSKLLDDELNRQELYNITVRIPLTAGQFYTATTARAAVPASVRKLGLKITYATSEGVWETYQFVGASTATWTTLAQWVKEPNQLNVTELLELPVAEVLNVLYAKIQALEAFIKASQYGNVTADQVDIVRNFNVWGKTNLIIEGTAAPTVVPDFVGQQFINTVGGVTYTAKGNTSVADWKQTSN